MTEVHSLEGEADKFFFVSFVSDEPNRRLTINRYAARLLADHPEYKQIKIFDNPILAKDSVLGQVMTGANIAILYAKRTRHG